ncbi:MAG: pyruvate dehydrogenase (acetyl-transferring), homodimeric type [Gammaproteobacteria bacterium]
MTNHHDIDALETQEWLAAFESLVEREGQDRAKFILNEVLAKADEKGVPVAGQLKTAYINTISVSEQPQYPGDLALEQKLDAAIRWNAIAMVLRAKRDAGGVGGHISSYNSIATSYEVGLNHFFKGRSENGAGDLIYFQGHSSEGNYARAFLEGRLDEQHLTNFRQEVAGHGLSSYPHPWLMPEFWQFATVSLGLGMMQGIYAARFMRYLQHRELANTDGRRVWVYCGDGEMDEPESRAGLAFAANEGLDNLTFVVNCNLQRLDGLVRSNFRILDELEGVFRGCGWNVIKVVWGSKWDALFEKDKTGALKEALNNVVDGDMQSYCAHGGAYFREHFFNQSPELQALVAELSDDDLSALLLDRGSHDPVKVYAAYDRAVKHKGQPTVVLLHGIKGYGLGAAAESKNIAHNQLDMNPEELKAFSERFGLPLTQEQLESFEFYHPGDDAPEIQYMHQRRQELGGYLPARFTDAEKLKAPELSAFDSVLKGTGDREASSTMVLARIFALLLKDKAIGKYLAPMFSDEVRTFGMEALFRQVGIYSRVGQKYTPEDKKQLMYYKEATNGQILMEGITEAGCLASWIAAGTSYSTNGVPMIPIFTYYSMFGFQRVGDFIWAAADMRTRGFLIGGTAGRTTLEGEGLQHQDGHSLLVAATVPNCIAYDPTFGYEIAVIMREGLRRMFEEQEDVFYYFMTMNEKYQHPEMPEGVEDDILKGLYLFRQTKLKASKLEATLLSSGAIFRETLAAAEMLEKDFKVKVNVWSATSFNELRRESLAKQRELRRNPQAKLRKTHVEKCLGNVKGPIIAATDYIRSYADQIREFISTDYHVLGTDGFGRSDTRQSLRAFFEVDRYNIAYTTIVALAQRGDLTAEDVAKAQKQYNIDISKPNPVSV